MTWPGKSRSCVCVLLVAIAVSFAVPESLAQDKLEMQGTRIIGNKELPNMLYIVPWKSIKPVEIQPPEIESVMHEPLQPLDRATLRRQLLYHDSLLSTGR